MVAGTSSRWIGLAKEATVGTYVAPTRYVALDSETLEPKPIINYPIRSGFSQPTTSHGYGIPETGDFVLKAPRVADMLLLIRGLWGLEGYTFTAGSPTAGSGRHVWTDFSNLPIDGTSGGTLATFSATINYDKHQIGYPGCWSDSLRLMQAIGQPLEATFGVIGSTTLATKDPSAASAQSPPTGRGFGNYTPDVAFIVKLAGTDITTLIKTVELSIQRGYDPTLFTSGSQQTASFQTPAGTTITGTLTTDKDDTYAATSIIANLLAKTDVTLELIWTSTDLAGASASTFETFDLLLTSIDFKGGIPHPRSGRTPPGYEGQFQFEAYRSSAPSLTIYGENSTVA